MQSREKYKKISFKAKVVRAFIHIPVGAAVPIFALNSLVVSVLFTLSFLVYELNEDVFHLKDRAYIDINGFLIGMALTQMFLQIRGVL